MSTPQGPHRVQLAVEVVQVGLQRREAWVLGFEQSGRQHLNMLLVARGVDVLQALPQAEAVALGNLRCLVGRGVGQRHGQQVEEFDIVLGFLGLAFKDVAETIQRQHGAHLPRPEGLLPASPANVKVVIRFRESISSV